MKYFSPLVSDARKKLGSSIWARNRAGLYQRAYKVPANPRTPSQVASRELFASINASWSAITPAQRDAWNSLALTQVLRDSLGQTFPPTGQTLFISCNRNLAYIGAPAIADAPAAEKPKPFTPIVSCVLTAAAGSLTEFSFALASSQSTFPSQAVIALSQPLAPTINFVSRYMLRRLTAAYSSSGTSVDITSAYASQFNTPVTGQRVMIALRQVDPTTGFSSPTTRYMATCA